MLQYEGVPESGHGDHEVVGSGGVDVPVQSAQDLGLDANDFVVRDLELQNLEHAVGLDRDDLLDFAHHEQHDHGYDLDLVEAEVLLQLFLPELFFLALLAAVVLTLVLEVVLADLFFEYMAEALPEFLIISDILFFIQILI